MSRAQLSLEAINCLRNCRLGIETDFVRCVPIKEDHSRYTDAKERMKAAMRIANEINEDGVYWSYSDEVGGDYVRVDRGTASFKLICQMKS
jgi:hypothetical protein